MRVKNYSNLKVHHINAVSEDFKGNNGLGRYIFLCGSAERAHSIGKKFNTLTVNKHARGHNLYLGTIKSGENFIDVGCISTGMGAPSIDIIMHELCILGARKFLRIGTAGSLQPHLIKVGDAVIASAAVRDESTTANYITRDFPAVASIELVNSAISAAQKLNLSKHTHVGIVHSKDSLYAREFGCSYLNENTEYMDYLKKSGTLASEMECSLIFTLSSIIGYHVSHQLRNKNEKIYSGAILSIIGDKTPFCDSKKVQLAIERSIDIGFETFRNLYVSESK